MSIIKSNVSNMVENPINTTSNPIVTLIYNSISIEEEKTKLSTRRLDKNLISKIINNKKLKLKRNLIKKKNQLNEY